MNKKMLVVYLLMLLIPINKVYADGISISCPNEIEKNSEFSCQLMGNSSTEITSFEASLTLEGEIKLISYRADIEVWAGGRENDELDKSYRELENNKNKILSDNKQLRFDLKSTKYKLMDMQQKYFDAQIRLAKEMQSKNPLLKFNTD